MSIGRKSKEEKKAGESSDDEFFDASDVVDYSTLKDN
jgi:hypothetical protein